MMTKSKQLLHLLEAKEWFDSHGWLLKKIPKECVKDCSGQGKVDEAVEYWVKKLNFHAPKEKAIEYLKEFGAWDKEELTNMSQEDIDQKVLWIACGDIKENGDWLGMVH